MLFRTGWVCRILSPICLFIFLLGQKWLPAAVTDGFAYAFMALFPTGLVLLLSDAAIDFWKQRAQVRKD